MKVELIKETDKLRESWFYWIDSETKDKLTPSRLFIDKAREDLDNINKFPIKQTLETKEI
jgi:hypothetical protein